MFVDKNFMKALPVLSFKPQKHTQITKGNADFKGGNSLTR